MNGENKTNLPNMNVIKGILAIIFGLAFIIWAYKIIVDMILFSAGVLLVYFGLVTLKVKPVTDVIDNIVGKIKKLLGQ